MMYIIMSQSYVKIASLQHFEISRRTRTSTFQCDYSQCFTFKNLQTETHTFIAIKKDRYGLH